MFQRYSLSSKDGNETVTVFENGDMFTANSTHPFWENIISNVRQGVSVARYFNVALLFYETFKTLSTDFSHSNGKLFYRNAPLPQSFEEILLAHKGDVEELKPLVRHFLKACDVWGGEDLARFHSLYKNERVHLVDSGDMILSMETSGYQVNHFFFPSEGGWRVKPEQLFLGSTSFVEIYNNHTHTSTHVTNPKLREDVNSGKLKDETFFSAKNICVYHSEKISIEPQVGGFTINGAPVCVGDHFRLDEWDNAVFQSLTDNNNAGFFFQLYPPNPNAYSNFTLPKLSVSHLAAFALVDPSDVVKVQDDNNVNFLVKKFTAISQQHNILNLTSDAFKADPIPTDEEVEQYIQQLT